MLLCFFFLSVCVCVCVCALSGCSSVSLEEMVYMYAHAVDELPFYFTPLNTNYSKSYVHYTDRNGSNKLPYWPSVGVDSSLQDHILFGHLFSEVPANLHATWTCLVCMYVAPL